MNEQTCCPIVIFLVFIYYIFNERLPLHH